MTAWVQETLQLPPYPRGFHLVTGEVEQRLPRLRDFRIGLAHVFILHTSASLTLNENADPTVRGDFERFFDRLIPDGASYFRHALEGVEDMPAHLKNAVLGASLTIPVRNGRLYLGTWQGIYLCEHRDAAGGRTLVVTLCGEEQRAAK